MAAPQLAPLPPPGLCLFPGYTARKHETFVMKQRKSLSSRNHYTVSFPSASGGPGQEFLIVDEDKRKQISFKTPKGQEIMRIVKQTHPWSGRGPEYHGMRGDGQEMWYLKLHRGLTGTDYMLTVNNTAYTSQTMLVQNKVLGQDKGILMNGRPVATMTQPNEWGHLHREDVIHVAPGMDILLAVGVNWIRADKQNMDTQTAVAAAT